MLRGFLNAMDSAADVAAGEEGGSSEECAARFLCEGAEEAAVRGRMGAAVAEVARWVGGVVCGGCFSILRGRRRHSNVGMKLSTVSHFTENL